MNQNHRLNAHALLGLCLISSLMRQDWRSSVGEGGGWLARCEDADW